MSTHYEFVVESSDEYGDIHDTIPFEDLDKAIERFNSEDPLPDGKVEICVCYITGNDLDGETDRQYLYRDEDGEWPTHFDAGRPVPQFVARQLARVPQAK